MLPRWIYQIKFNIWTTWFSLINGDSPPIFSIRSLDNRSSPWASNPSTSERVATTATIQNYQSTEVPTGEFSQTKAMARIDKANKRDRPARKTWSDNLTVCSDCMPWTIMFHSIRKACLTKWIKTWSVMGQKKTLQLRQLMFLDNGSNSRTFLAITSQNNKVVITAEWTANIKRRKRNYNWTVAL